MTAPKSRPRARKTVVAKTPEQRGWELGPIPDDIFGSADDPPEPKSRRAPHLNIPARLRAVTHNPDIYRAAAAVFIKPEGPTPGRPQKYQPHIYLIYDCAISIFGTATATESNLAAPEFWNIVREGIRSVLGDEEADALLDRGPTRGNWSYFFAKYLKPNLAALRETSRDLWLQQALESGLLEMDEGTWIRPACGQTVHGDATVAHPASGQTERQTPDRLTGRMKNRRVDPDATYATEGGGNVVYGNKYLSLAVRAADTPHSRVVLDLETLRFKKESEDPDKESEGNAVVAGMLRIRKHISGLLAFTYDKALHGVHRAPLIAAGITVYTPQVENLQPQPLQTVTHEHCCHELYAAAGRVCERLVPADGSRIIYNPLPATAFHPRPGGRYRFYHQIKVPCRYGPHFVLIRVDETAQDRQIMSNGRKRFNRTHHLRMVYPGTPAGARLAGFRQDSESKHSTWDQSYRHKHVPAYGADGGLALYFGYAWLSNSIARAYAGKV